MAETRSRRRLVQSTLFPRIDSSIKESQRSDWDRGEEIEDEDNEWSGRSEKGCGGKRKNNSKPKATPRASYKKVSENGGDTSSKQVRDSDSPVFAKSAFFFRCSEKQQLNQPVFIDSPEQNDGICSTPSSTSSTPQKSKRRNNSTPGKERKHSTPSKKLKSGQRGSCCSQIPFDLDMDEQPSPILPNLRLEAKLTAEENSRIFAGRQIHPFFTSRKMGKKNQDSTYLESNWPSFGMEKGIAFNPIHVFENAEEDDHVTLDWGHWILSERTSTNTLEHECSPVYEGSIETINFDNLMSVPHFTQTSSCERCHQYPFQHKDISQEMIGQAELSSLSLVDTKNNLCKQSMDTEMLPKDAENIVTSAQATSLDQGLVKYDPFAGNSCQRTLDPKLQDELLHERIMSHYHTSSNEPVNRLWTEKYQPQNAKQVCGNGESVRLLSEWLNLWHQKGSLTSGSYTGGDKLNREDTDIDYQLTDSDSDTNDGESLKNVLLVTGPVGSGKSAAIYTCAREQGFQIIEINASDWRNGSLIKQKFGEAAESHWCRRTVDDTYKSDETPMSKFFKSIGTKTYCSNNDVIDLTNLTEDSLDSGACKEVSCSGNVKSASHHDKIKTLILFEDIDATLCEDHGFITTIEQLAQTAKRPMILTSNNGDPVLPKNMDRFRLSFSAPTVEELLGLLHMICNAEKAEINPCILERFADYCQRDIRKTITHLQFWCQGYTFGRDKKASATYWPIGFDPDAAHRILPRVIHCVCPSQLSQVVAEEIFKSVTLMEEFSGFMVSTNLGKDVNDFRAEIIPTQESESDRIELKKEEMLSLHCLDDDVDCAGDGHHFDFSCSPVELPPQNRRRKVNTVLSSDSEDEVSGGKFSSVPASANVKFVLPDLNEIPISNCLSGEMHLQSIEPIYQADVDNLEDNYQLPVEVEYSHLEDTCISHDASLVPESSFVPETEIMNESRLHSITISSGHLEEQDSIPILEPILATNFSEALSTLQNEESLGNTRDPSAACVCIEEVADSLSKSYFDVPVRYQAMDECSRVDFLVRLNSLSDTKSDQFNDDVQETWKKLQDQSNDLRKYVTSEEKTVCKLLTYAHGISDVISEVDLLLKDCQPQISDFLEPLSYPNEKAESHSYYDDQVNMSSILAQHGMCLYAREISNIGCSSSFDLASEMLSASTCSIALGKLAAQHKRSANKLDNKTYKSSDLFRSKSKSPLRDILHSVVPSKSYLAANGGAFHEYISTLGQISRYEFSRLSECLNNRKQRRSRVSRHYLSSGSLTLSQEEISMLDLHNSYQKDFFASQR